MSQAKFLYSTQSAIYGIIGVWRHGPLTYYVKRSQSMQNYPGLWSLFSIQYERAQLFDPIDLGVAQCFMERMSHQRLGGERIIVRRHLISGDSGSNPMKKHVYLHLYEVELEREPRLNSEYYVQGEWLTPEQYENRSAGNQCGLCLRLWSDYAWLSGIHDRPFIPHEMAVK